MLPAKMDATFDLAFGRSVLPIFLFIKHIRLGTTVILAPGDSSGMECNDHEIKANIRGYLGRPWIKSQKF